MTPDILVLLVAAVFCVVCLFGATTNRDPPPE